MKNILIADDHWIVRTGLKDVVRKAFTACNIFEADAGDEVIQWVKKQPLDLILLDLMMPDTDPVALLTRLQSHYASVPVLIVTMNAEEAYGKRFLKLGAKGFVRKNAREEELIKAITAVADGGKYISDDLMKTISNDYFTDRPSNPFEALSAREFQVAVNLAKGLESVEISNLLAIQYSTVSTHKQRIFEKLNIQTHRELVELARVYDI